MAKENKNLRRRVFDSLANGPSEEGQHVLYSFLLELDTIMERQVKTEEDLKQLRSDYEQWRAEYKECQKRLESKLDGVTETVQPLANFTKLRDKAKTGLILVLGAYLLKDSPVGLKFLTSFLTGT